MKRAHLLFTITNMDSSKTPQQMALELISEEKDYKIITAEARCDAEIIYWGIVKKEILKIKEKGRYVEA